MKVIIHELIRITPGRQHAWVNTNVGILRKPLASLIPKSKSEKLKWWQRLVQWIKRKMKAFMDGKRITFQTL